MVIRAAKKELGASAAAAPGLVCAATKKPARDPTSFEQRLYKVCSAIPRGKVSTYGTMAKALHTSARAVGQALRRNPYAPEVPCHRVVAASLELGGFSGSWGDDTPEVQRKRALLTSEGVAFTSDGARVSAACLVGAAVLEAAAGTPA